MMYIIVEFNKIIIKGGGAMKLTKNNIVKVQDKYMPKAILVLVDELSEVMNDTNYKLVSSIQNSLGSIARLGRAAG